MQALAACGYPHPCRTAPCCPPSVPGAVAYSTGVCTNWWDVSSILDLAAALHSIPAWGRNYDPASIFPFLGLLCRVYIRLVRWHGAIITTQGASSSRGSVTMRAISTLTSHQSMSGTPCKMSSPTGPTHPPSSQMCKLVWLCWAKVFGCQALQSPNEETVSTRGYS